MPAQHQSMHCSSLNVTERTRFAEISPLNTQRDALLATILSRNMEKSTSNKKRSCPFDEPASRRHSNDDIKALQHDVEELEIRLAAVTRKTIKPTKKLRSVHHHTILQACYQQAQQKINAKRSFSVLPKCGQLEYEHKLDEPVYQRLNKSVALQYEQLAQVFSDAGLNQSRTDYYDARVVTGTQQGTFVRFSLAKIAPFAVAAVNSALWNSVKKNSVLKVGADHVFEGSNSNTVYLKTECMLQGDSSFIPVLLRGVCRRFVESDRVVVVWEGTGDWPKDYLRSHPSCAPIRERGYCVVQTLQSDKNNNVCAPPLSLFQSCICMTPGLSDDIDMNQPECIQMLTDVVIPSYRKLLDAREHILENALLDEMIDLKTGGSKFRL